MAVITTEPPELDKKTAKEQLTEDAAYVTNHALSCAFTDTLIQPPVGAFVQTQVEHGKTPKWLAWTKRIFEPPDHHNHTGHAHGPKSGFLNNTRHWMLGEAAGDVGAIPLTILTQRAFPGLIRGLRTILEPIAGKFFHKGAKRDAEHWAKTQGISPESAEVQAHEHALYEREMRHLPLAVVWNAFSIPINLMTQKLSGSKASLGTLAVGKTFGSLFSNLALIGGRAASPATFEKWDKFNSDHFIAPVTNAVLKPFDIDKDATARIVKEHTAPHKQDHSWVERSERDAESPQLTNSR